jgi:hypothetical protein
LSEHAQQLEQEDAQLGLLGTAPDLVLQRAQCDIELTVSNGLFSSLKRHTRGLLT